MTREIIEKVLETEKEIAILGEQLIKRKVEIDKIYENKLQKFTQEWMNNNNQKLDDQMAMHKGIARDNQEQHSEEIAMYSTKMEEIYTIRREELVRQGVKEVLNYYGNCEDEADRNRHA